MKVEWFGTPGHFCAADRCNFRLHAHVNGYCISTIGEYRPTMSGPIVAIGSDSEKGGPGRTYETMVFRLVPDGNDVDPAELEMRAYWERDDANAGHMDAIERWAAK